MSVIPRQLLTVLGAAVEPLEAALDSVDVLDGVLADVGIVVALTEDQRDAVARLAGLDALQGIGGLVAAARAGEPLDLAAIARLTDAVSTAVAGFEALASGSADLSDLPAPLDDEATWRWVVGRLPDALLSRAIEGLAPTSSAVLAAVRVLRVDEGSDGLPGRRWIDWALLGGLIGGDWRSVVEAYGWGTAAFDPGATIELLADVAGRAGFRYQRAALDIEIDGARYDNSDPTMRQLEVTVFHGSTGTVAGAVGAAIVPVPAVDGDGLDPDGLRGAQPLDRRCRSHDRAERLVATRTLRRPRERRAPDRRVAARVAAGPGTSRSRGDGRRRPRGRTDERRAVAADRRTRWDPCRVGVGARRGRGDAR